MTTMAVKPNGAEVLEQVIIKGNLAQLEPYERVAYYNEVCKSMGLNPYTSPFAYIQLQGKLTLYALKGATDQLRALRGVSIEPPKIEYFDDLIVVSVMARDKTGRTDADSGAVVVDGLKGEAKANAIMKAITKAKRRVTLSICGLGMLDETEVETIPEARAWTEPEPPQPTRTGPEMITGPQVTALSIALTEAGFRTDEGSKAQGRAFIAWMLEQFELASVKELTKAQAQRVLDRIGSGTNGDFRTDRSKLDKLFQEYAEWQSGSEFDAEPVEDPNHVPPGPKGT